MGLVDKLRAKMELYRLEQRYTRRGDRRSTFYANAEYVNGEYVFKPSADSLYASTAAAATTTNASSKRATIAKVSEIFPSSRVSRSV